MNRSNSKIDIAIIGMAGRFPGANSVDEFWSNIVNKVDSIIAFNDEELVVAGIPFELLQNPNYVKTKGYLENADYFDAEFFKFSKHESELLDPQYRLFLEVVWEALENAAYVPDNYLGRIGIFAGSSNIDTYYFNNLLQKNSNTFLTDNFTILLHNAKDFLSSLIAYKLNLRGPAITVQTACSTSLVAVCQACKSLLNFETDMALAGGACITVPLKSGYLFQNGMMLSPTGKCSAFDKNADGIVLGNGLGVVLLKRLPEALRDGDNVHAIIQGFAVNNDGGNKIGFTAPSVTGQQAVIQEALTKAKVCPEMISYVESHGTGTILGDLIEIEALTKVFKKCTKNIFLGSVKPNIGHLDAASGIAGLIKVVQALKYKNLPPNINFTAPSPQINLTKTPFQIITTNTAWESNGAKRYAGISSFGIGGTNAHVILTEALREEGKKYISKPVVIVLSAKTTAALNQIRENLKSFLKENSSINLADVAYTLQIGRKNFKYRTAYICSNMQDAIHLLQQSNESFSLMHIGDAPQHLVNIASKWLTGEEVNWSVLYRTGKYQRIPLPTYPFERKRYWVSQNTLTLPPFKSATSKLVSDNISYTTHIDNIESTIKKIFERFLIQEDIDVMSDFTSLGGDSLVALLITHEINKTLNVKLPFSIFANNLSIRTLSEYIANHIENK